MKTLYVCGPMTGLPEFNYPAFNLTARMLREAGYAVENPAENPDPPGRTHSEYMRMAIAQLVKCDGVAYLDGWEGSRGAHIEIHLAQALEIPIKQWSRWLWPIATTD